MATKTNGISASALAFALASLGGSGSGSGSGTPGKPGKDGTRWFVVNEPLADGNSAPIGAKVGDLVLDNSGEIFEVVSDVNGPIVKTTNVVLGGGTEPSPEPGVQKDLYELYKEIAGAEAVSEAEFNKKFIELIADSGQIGVTDRIVSADGKSSVVASKTGVVVDSQGDTTNGAVEIHNLKNPVSDLDAVNLRFLKEYVDMRLKQFYDWMNGIYIIFGGDADDNFSNIISGGDADGVIDNIINGGDADDNFGTSVTGGKSNTMDSEYEMNLDGNNLPNPDTIILNGGASKEDYSNNGENNNGGEGDSTFQLSEKDNGKNLLEDDNIMTINLFGGGAG